HIDHSGLIPRLVAEGFDGTILSTPATRDLCKIMLQDSAKIQESDVRFVNKRKLRQNKPLIAPLYTMEDALQALSYFKKVKYNEQYQVTEGVKLTFTDAGHIIGSAAVHLDIEEDLKTTKITFSGD